MATELWKFRLQVEELMKARSEHGSEPGDSTSNQSNHGQRLSAAESQGSDYVSHLQRRLGKSAGWRGGEGE